MKRSTQIWTESDLNELEQDIAWLTNLPQFLVVFTISSSRTFKFSWLFVDTYLYRFCYISIILLKLFEFILSIYQKERRRRNNSLILIRNLYILFLPAYSIFFIVILALNLWQIYMRNVLPNDRFPLLKETKIDIFFKLFSWMVWLFKKNRLTFQIFVCLLILWLSIGV